MQKALWLAYLLLSTKPQTENSNPALKQDASGLSGDALVKCRFILSRTRLYAN
jgi:hypothetical protein